MISRFTLDSATEFLFGKDVCSLSAGLVYPPDSPLATNIAFQNHPANQFAHAFLEAQSATSYRGRFGRPWRLFEFWSDRVKKHMHVCHEFIDPILKEALSKKKASKEAGLIPEKSAKEREVLEGETLLDHLVNYTEGECFPLSCILLCIHTYGLFRSYRDQRRNLEYHDRRSGHGKHMVPGQITHSIFKSVDLLL